MASSDDIEPPRLNTSIQLPPSQIVSPLSMSSPTPTPGADANQMRFNFWDAALASSNNLTQLRASPRGTPVATPAGTPSGEQKNIFWEPVVKDNNTSNDGAMRGSGIGPAGSSSRVTSPVRSPGERSVLWEAPKWEPSRGDGLLSPNSKPRRPSTVRGKSSENEKKSLGYFAPRIKGSMTKLRNAGHKVTFSDVSTGSDASQGSKASSVDHNESSQSDNSRPGSPASGDPATRPPFSRKGSTMTEEQAIEQARARIIQLVDKRAVAIALEQPTPTVPRKPPFVAYTDTFLQILGSNPMLEEVMHDQRLPFFSGSGCFHRPTSTLFITSNFMKDLSPSAAPSRNYTVTTSSLTFYANDEITRDKVRFAENHMLGGICVWYPPAAPPAARTFPSKATSNPNPYPRPISPTLSSSLIVCAQGTLSNPSGLLLVAAKRPHTVTPLLTTYAGGRPFNSPHACTALSDGSVLFTDPPVGYEIGFRTRPQMAPLIYRFDPATGDVRAIADGLTRPMALAVSPDERTLYVVDAPRPARIPGKGAHVDDVLDACTAPQPTVQAYSLVGVGVGAGSGPGVFLTNKRLFAFPERLPTGLAVSARGDVFMACGVAGVMVYGRDGSLVGRVRVGEGESVAGVCTGRKGELFCWGGHKVWRVSLEAGRLA